MGYRLLDHATDAIIELEEASLEEAFETAAGAVIDITLNAGSVCEKQQYEFTASGKDLRYLLLDWLEQVIYVLITQGFAIKRLHPVISKNGHYAISCVAYGEPMDLARHGFRMEIKAPTFYDMEIRENNQVYMRFLLDL